jgi:hypothetical protein
MNTINRSGPDELSSRVSQSASERLGPNIEQSQGYACP